MMNCIVRRLQAHDGQLERTLCHSDGTPEDDNNNNNNDDNENWPESKVAMARKCGSLELIDAAANWRRGPDGMDSQDGSNLDCDRHYERGQSGRGRGQAVSGDSLRRRRSSPSASCDLGGRKQTTTTRGSPPGPARVLWLASFALLASCSILLASGQQSIIIDNSHHFRGGSGATSNKVASATTTTSTNNTSDHHNHLLAAAAAASKLGQHFQPASLLAVQNKSINFTHVAVDELTGTIYLGATNWLLQVSGRDLRLEQALRTGPTSSDSSLARDCTPADCMLQLAQVELNELLPRLLVQGHNVADLSGREQQLQGHWNSNSNSNSNNNNQRRAFTGATLHNSLNSSSSGGGLGSPSTGFGLLQHRRPTAAPMGGNITSATTTTTSISSQMGFSASGPAGTPSAGQQQQHNNYNKILTIDYASGHLIVCGSLNQGACRRHQLGNLANFSELVPLPVASDDELSSTVALVVGGAGGTATNKQQVIAGQGKQQQQPILYVAATNSRLGPPQREMVPAISARSLDWSSRDRAMQIIEHSFTDLARVDISFGLRDYYLVNYVHAFQHNNFIYFVTVQRKSALLQLEEWGYVTRLVRLCQNDLSFQSYAEMTLECSMEHPAEHSLASVVGTGGEQQRNQRQQSPTSGRTNYNLLQDAHLMQAGSQLAQQLGLTGGGGGGGHSLKSSSGSAGAAVLVGAFSQSRDHTARSSQRSAICLFPMERIEQKFQENIDLCYNGTIKSRNMDYIAGSVNDCPRQQGPIRNQQNYCNEPVKLNGSLALVAEPIQTSESELITSITSTLAPTSPINLQWSGQSGGKQQQANSIRQHQVLVAGTSDGQLKRFVVVASGARVGALEFDSVSLAASAGPTPAPSAASSPGTSGAGEPGQQSSILADLHLVPAVNPQLSISTSAAHSQDRHQQFVLAASAQKLVKLRVNACKASAQRQQRHSPANNRQQSTAAPAPGNNSSIVDECLACSQLQDPFCGWCSSLASCTTRDECLIHSIEQLAAPAVASDQSQQQQHQQQQPSASIHWTPFDSIRCSNYQPVSPKNVPIQADASLSSSHLTLIDVNVRLNLRHNAAVAAAGANQQQLAARLSQAQFVCHFDYLSLWNKSATQAGSQQQQRSQPTGATTKATQARLNLHAGTAVIGCPLPVSSQRPSLRHQSHLDHARVKLSVRLTSTGRQEQSYEEDTGRWLLEQVLGMRSLRQQQAAAAAAANQHEQLQNHLQTPPVDSIERELTFYDCSLNSNCHSCLSSGSQGRRWSCAWCPLSQKCTFNASHPDFGCAASAVASTTPHSANLPAIGGGVSSASVAAELRQIRGSQLTVSLDRAQTSMLGLAIDRLERCPKQADSTLTSAPSASAAASNTIESDYNFAHASRASSGALDGSDGNGLYHNGRPASTLSTGASDIPQAPPPPLVGGKQQAIPVASAINPGSSAPLSGSGNNNIEILVPNNVRRAVQVGLARPVQHYLPRDKRVMKLECLIELEGAKARFSARLLDNSNVACQESLFSYQADIATQPARLSVILNDNQVIETTDVIIYKCHLFGVNPPAIASSIVTAATALPAVESDADSQDTTQRYRPHHNHHSSASWSSSLNELLGLLPSSTLLANGANPRRQSDCSLCLNVDRKYQCVWCSSQCRHTEQCQELPTSTCPPPQIDSIHPTSGPLEGGTLLTIEGSNLGSNEREIQDKILVGGEQCQLVMYSVSTRIVCKTGPSLVGPQSATVFVGNRAGVTSAHEKFDYKAIHLADVNPRVGPVSGGTRLLLTGANLNIGSRVQILLDEIPCQLDSQFLMTSNQIACITGPNLFASSSMRIKQLTLIVDNSSHQLPFPFTYQPDPIITSIEPAESFLSGGRLILINGQHLDSPQSIKLQLQLEQRASVTNSTACQRLNDTLITCLTPAFSRADLREALEMSGQQEGDQLAAAGANSLQDLQSGWAYEGGSSGGGGGGVKLKMSLLMDDVRSVRNLDEYYHHLPHYISYFEDPHLQPLEPNQVDYREELVILGQHLGMRQLDQDMQISVGLHICRIKSIEANRILVEPPPMIAPVFDYNDSSRRRVLVDRPLLPIVALIGANLRFELGFMRYSSSQYLAAGSPAQLGQSALELESFAAEMSPEQLLNLSNALVRVGGHSDRSLTTLEQTDGGGSSSSMGFKVLLALGSLGFVLAISTGLALAMARFKQTRAQQREYKRIQLQMGSLDQAAASGNAPAGSGNLFASVLFDKNKGLHHQLFASPTQPVIMDYVGNTTTKSKPLHQFFMSNNNANGHQQQVLSSFPPSPLTDISSLVGSSPNHPNLQQQQQQQQQQQHHQQQHVVKLNASGQVISSTASQHQYAGLYAPAGSSASSSSSGTSPLRSGASSQQRNLNSSSARNFNWTQKAPSTIVPYAVIAACNPNSDLSQTAAHFN